MSRPHIALLPGAGMGHLGPCLRIAAMLASRSCLVTLITPHTTVSAAESAKLSTFFANYPQINRLDFQLLQPADPSAADDPFFIQMECVARSVPPLRPVLSALSPPLSAIFSDFTAAASFVELFDDIPIYVISVTSARFMSFMSYIPYLISESENSLARFNGKGLEIEIPGLSPLPVSYLPPPLLSTEKNLFTSIILANAPSLSKTKGIIINTFESFDPEAISAFNNGRVLSNYPPLLPIGPIESCNFEEENDNGPSPKWLDSQLAESVIYVCFGNKLVLSREQMKELGDGLDRSGFPFLWVLKTQKVDRDDKEELQELLGADFLERTKNKGKIMKDWISQDKILGHPAIGGFLSHCGWNSVMEAAQKGIPMLVWPAGGDQKVNAVVVEKAGQGSWPRDWSGIGDKLVPAEEIEKEVRKLITDDKLRAKARRVSQEAKMATSPGGSSEKVLQGLLEQFKKPQASRRFPA